MMKISESPSQLVATSGSTTITLDRNAGKATVQRKLLLWSRKPVEMPLSEICECAVDAAVDRASGAEICNTLLVTRDGASWALPADDKKEAQSAATQLCNFLGLGAPTIH